MTSKNHKTVKVKIKQTKKLKYLIQLKKIEHTYIPVDTFVLNDTSETNSQ